MIVYAITLSQVELINSILSLLKWWINVVVKIYSFYFEIFKVILTSGDSVGPIN